MKTKTCYEQHTACHGSYCNRETLTAKFAPGHTVRRRSFTDCFGVFQPASGLLTVTRISLVRSEGGTHGIKPYYRVLAKGTKETHEGAEWFFIFAAEVSL